MRTESPHSGDTPGWGLASTCGALAMAALSPFIAFVAQHGYPLSPEVLAVVVGVVAACCLVALALRPFPWWVSGLILASTLAVVFEHFGDFSLKWSLLGCLIAVWILRRHVVQIVGLMFVAFNAASLISCAPISGDSPVYPVPADDATVRSAGSMPATPSVIHLILDGQIGIDGFPELPEPNVLGSLREDLLDHGFTVYGRAYSQYGGTRDSLPNLFNFSSATVKGEHTTRVRSREFEVTLTHNAYLDFLDAPGRRIYVVQNSYLDLCSAAANPPYYCGTYPANSIGALAGKPIGWREKSLFMLGNFATTVGRVGWLRSRYLGVRGSFAPLQAITPEWQENRYWTSAVVTLDVMDALPGLLESMQGGDVLLVHLLLPHPPYSLDQVCNIRPNASSWLWERKGGFDGLVRNTPESRSVRYELYLDQIECLRLKLREFLRAIEERPQLEDATVILHGDHGSKIRIRVPSQGAPGEHSHADLRDTHSTLFAIRTPKREAVYLRDPIKIQAALAAGLGVKSTSFDPEDRVFLEPGKDGDSFAPEPVEFFQDAAPNGREPAAR